MGVKLSHLGSLQKGLDGSKTVFGSLRTIKVQTSLHILQSVHRLCYSLIGKYYI